MDCWVGVPRRNLHGGVHFRGGRASDQQRDFHAGFFHFHRDVDHFVQRRRDEPRQPKHVRFVLFACFQDRFRGTHDPKVDHTIIVAPEHDRHDVFPNIVHIAFHGRNHHRACVHFLLLRLLSTRQRCQPRFLLLFLHVRNQHRHRLLHHARALDHLWQEHLPCSKQITHNVHSVHQRPFNHVQRLRVRLPRFFRVCLHVLINSFHERVLQAAFNRELSPLVLLLVRHLARAFLAHRQRVRQ
mmetsp:Transcript_10941/g.23390  ORF Transcript_10941/g.23390 Transcript_10941/m.23390 type:complete len:241 (+) Transcript_10941:1510-2232(+)